MKALILAGGSGTRLWPLSRRNFPKQFMKLNEDRSLLQQTAERLLKVLSPDDIVIMTNNDYRFHVKTDLDTLGISHILLEPASRNTAPAIALGIKYCIDKLDCNGDDIIFISPSDHIIRPVDKFVEHIKQAEKVAKMGNIVTFGIKPDRPETGYGYIKVRRQSKRPSAKNRIGKSEVSRLDYFEVEKFVEKPDANTAKTYLQEGTYYWNSGMFAFRIDTMIDEFKRHTDEIGEMFNKEFDEVVSGFKRMPEISIDFAVMEKSNDVTMLPLDLYWNDIGSWDSIYDVLDKDENKNVKKGDVLTIDTKETLVISDKRFISTIGLEDCLIVESDDAILVAKKGETQKVKNIVNKLKADSRREATEHLTTYRPWGSYAILDEGPRYKIKRIVVSPNEKLSSQMHLHRSEHWVVVRGTAKVTIGEKEIFIHENESAYVPKSTIHRLENPGKVPLEMIEVQNGEYVGEDDIKRFDDIYGREG